MSNRRVAFFDLDKTLISRNSATLWIRFELAAGRVTRWQALHAFTYVVRYNFGTADMTDAIRRSVAMIAGQPEAELRERARVFYDQLVRPLYRPGARLAVAAHRAAGDHLVLGGAMAYLYTGSKFSIPAGSRHSPRICSKGR